MRNDFDRRLVSDLGFMRLRLLGLLRRLRARQTRLHVLAYNMKRA